MCNAFLKAAAAEGEGAWRMPMGQAYDDKLKSRIADMMNVGGREGGAIVAAQFIKRFIKDGIDSWVLQGTGGPNKSGMAAGMSYGKDCSGNSQPFTYFICPGTKMGVYQSLSTRAFGEIIPGDTFQ